VREFLQAASQSFILASLEYLYRLSNYPDANFLAGAAFLASTALEVKKNFFTLLPLRQGGFARLAFALLTRRHSPVLHK
jgi:hypothetical protein